MGSGVSMFTGAFVSTGALMSVLTPGFSPRAVRLIKAGGTVGTIDWTQEMGDGAAFKQVGGTATFVTTGGITAVDEGFTFGTDAMNTAGTTWYYEAFR